MNVIPTDSDFQWTKPLRQTQAWPKHRRWAKPLCPLPKGLLLGPGKGVNEISVGQQTAPPVTKGRTIFATRTFEKQSGWGRGGAAGVQPRHSCPGDRGRGPSGSRALPSTGQGLTLIKFHHLDRSHTLPLTDLSSLTTKPGTNVKKVQNRLWTIKTLAKTKNLNKPN